MTHTGPCPCWQNTNALGHDGECCFLEDDHHTWRPDNEICHDPHQGDLLNLI